MKFRVTSIVGDEEGNDIVAITGALEDALNMELSKKNYGSNLDQLTILLVTANDDIEDNKKWAANQCRLAHLSNAFTGERIRYLSIGVPVDRAIVLGSSKQRLRTYVVQTISEALSVRPKRLAAGLDYESLSAAMRITLATNPETPSALDSPSCS